MTTNSTHAIYSRTHAGESALSETKLALSVTQRKLLALIDGATPLDQLTYDSVFDATRVERDIARLAELGLVASPDAPRIVRETSSLSALRPPHPDRSKFPSNAPKFAAIGLAVIGIGGVAFWMLQKPSADMSMGQAAGTAAVSNAQFFVQTTQVHVGEDAPANGPIKFAAPRPMNVPAVSEPASTPAASKSTASKNNAENTRSASPATSTANRSQPAQTATTPATQSNAAPAQPAPKPAEAPRPAAPPPTLASAAPTTAPEAVHPQPAKQSVLVPVSRIAPEFPREAISEGVDKGNVKVRLTIDKNGNVKQVDIIEATPRHLFDRAVRRALVQWKFPPGEDKRVAETEVVFKAAQ